jgi:hypothetical protein
MVDDWTYQLCTSMAAEGKRPQEGFYRIALPRWKRRGNRKEYLPARIFRPIPLDPDTGEVIDRWPHLEAECNGKSVDIQYVWAWGETISKGEFEWLTALTPILR